MIVSFGSEGCRARRALRADQQVADEQRMPGKLGHDARRQRIDRHRHRRSDPGRTGPCRRHARACPASGARSAPATSACCCPTRSGHRCWHRGRRTCPSASGRCAGRSRRAKGTMGGQFSLAPANRFSHREAAVRSYSERCLRSRNRSSPALSPGCELRTVSMVSSLRLRLVPLRTDAITSTGSF